MSVINLFAKKPQLPQALPVNAVSTITLIGAEATETGALKLNIVKPDGNPSSITLNNSEFNYIRTIEPLFEAIGISPNKEILPQFKKLCPIDVKVLVTRDIRIDKITHRVISDFTNYSFDKNVIGAFEAPEEPEEEEEVEE